MPDYTKYLFRLWCKSCGDFTLHERVFRDEINHLKYSACTFKDGKDFASICHCGSQYSPVNILSIDKDKIEIQRARFKSQRMKALMDSLNVVANG